MMDWRLKFKKVWGKYRNISRFVCGYTRWSTRFLNNHFTSNRVLKQPPTSTKLNLLHQGFIFRSDTLNRQRRGLDNGNVPVQTVSTSFKHHFSSRRFHFVINHEDTYPAFINATTTSTATHLYVLSTRYPSKLVTIKLTHICKHNSFCRHVQTYAEGLCGKQTLKKKFQSSWNFK